MEQATLYKKLDVVMCEVPKGPLGVAVSGGGDSVALLHLLVDWAKENGCTVYAATVNHNLREAAASEASFVAGLCETLDIPHTILEWKGWSGQGNLQNAARNARKELLADWALQYDLSSVALGHTQDDQAETFLMRLARGSGVDGLSGMRFVTGDHPIWVRPLLDIKRQELRVYLSNIGQEWIDDPTNDDEDFDRVKMRKALPVLTELGLSIERLAQTAEGLQSPRQALEQATQDAAYKCCKPNQYGVVDIDLEALQREPMEIQYRLMSSAMSWVSGNTYRPRFTALKTTYGNILTGQSQTLAGCFLKSDGRRLVVMREIAQLRTVELESEIYDGRWRVSAEGSIQMIVGPLGKKGLPQVSDWRDLGVMRDVLMQTPAVWLADKVICAPLAGLKGDVSISLKTDPNHFYKDIVSH